MNDNYYPALIICDPKINGGEPTVRSLRVTVRTILASLAEGAWIDEILADFPSLSEEQLRAVIAIAADVALEHFSPQALAQPREGAQARQAAVDILDSWISGDAVEQKETGEELVRLLDEDRLSARSLFPSELKGVTW